MQVAPKVRLDRIASIEGTGVEGSLVSLEQPVNPGVKLLFVSTDIQGQQQTSEADDMGQIRANLQTGGWLVYVFEKNGKAEFHQRLEVRGSETKLLILTKR